MTANKLIQNRIDEMIKVKQHIYNTMTPENQKCMRESESWLEVIDLKINILKIGL